MDDEWVNEEVVFEEANDPLARATKDQRNGSMYCNTKKGKL